MSLLGRDLVFDSLEKVRVITERLNMAQSRQKFRSIIWRRDLEFSVDDWVAYELELPLEMAMVHPMFHVSILRKYVDDPSSTIPLKVVNIEENLTYEEVSVESFDQQVKILRNKEVSFLKVL
ncbi:uncharacterized protein LOC129899827 [Solanum dulcamara]|uniref:uncharacterized protein LOC129899827 n=1 Tax=Solanum dulcamara TaxID=45834 RepID=UPI0024855771|nr:uncharacterized protein LOC129899827 [Solanum dulcamara]